MGCIQSYFKKAATGSTQTSPVDIIKHIVDYDHHSKTTTESNKVSAVLLEETRSNSDEPELDTESEKADQRSLHYVEATAIRQLAASTGSVAILGTTAKCKENINYRHSFHSEQGLIFENRNVVSEQGFPIEEQNQVSYNISTSSNENMEPTNIIITAIIEAPPCSETSILQDGQEPETLLQAQYKPAHSPIEDSPQVVESFVTLQIEKAETSTKELSDVEDIFDDSKTNENSERESSSSEIISVVKDNIETNTIERYCRSSLDSTRPNRLSMGQQSIESDQNTVEISSADDVKNESTDITSPDSLKGSLDDKSLSLNNKYQDGESFRDEMARTISNTSLNTLGNDSEDDGSNLEGEGYRKSELSMKRFDTISSNGESSYQIEEPHNSSTSEIRVHDSKYEASIRETVIIEVDKICQQAVEKTTDILMSKMEIEETKDIEDSNNVSEYSLFSTQDSIVAEKGSDFDSLSCFDDQSDSRSISTLGDDTKGKQEIQSNNIENVQIQQIGREKLEHGIYKNSENTLRSVIQKPLPNYEGINIQSENGVLPVPPNFKDMSPLQDHLNRYVITEREIQVLPENVPTEHRSIEIDKAASKIQATVRGYLSRKQSKNIKNKQDIELSGLYPVKTDSFDEECAKTYRKNKRFSLDSKLVDIDNVKKLPKLKSTLSECIEEETDGYLSDANKAASKIQNVYRSYCARKSICLGILNTKQEKQHGDDDKNDNNNNSNGNILDGAEHIVKKHMSLENDGAQLPGEGEKSKSEDPVKQAVVKIQATYRGFKARKSLQLSATAATKIQAHFRGYKVRKNLNRCSSLNDMDANSNSSSCNNLSSQPDLDKHATLIQAGIRGYLVRKRHSFQNNAASKIQINYRKYKSRKIPEK